jgi:hypothetical protein
VIATSPTVTGSATAMARCYYPPEVSILPYTQVGVQKGQLLTYSVTISNRAPVRDNYELSIESFSPDPWRWPSWAAELGKYSVKLDVGESVSVDLIVTDPPYGVKYNEKASELEMLGKAREDQIKRDETFIDQEPEYSILSAEFYRVLKDNGEAIITVPHKDTWGAKIHPEHKTFWDENSMEYYTNPYFIKKYQSKCYFRLEKLIKKVFFTNGIKRVHLTFILKAIKSVKDNG